MRAKELFDREEKKGLAVDLGAGTGRDTLFLLKNGWRVLALDADPLAINIILDRVNEEELESPFTEVSSFVDMILPNNVDLINASYSLPFCHPEEFFKAWQTIVDHLAVGGRFSGHFFGENDERAQQPNCTALSEEQLYQLFKENFEIEFLEVQQETAPTASGELSNCHVFHVVAKKIQ